MTFLLDLLSFLTFTFILFTLPGFYLINYPKNSLTFWEKLFLGSILGFVLFTLISYFALLVKFPPAALVSALLLAGLSLPALVKELKSLKFPGRRQLFTILIVFIIGIFGQMAVIAPSGSIVNGELLFWSSHGHDGPWHISLMQELNKGTLPFQNPVFAGERLINYHFFSDIAPALFNKWFGLSELDLYFRFFPLLFSLFFGASAYFLGKRLGGSFLPAIMSAFFAYFAGSFGYIATFIKNRSIGGESIFWASQPQSSVGNPPQIISNFMILAIILLIQNYILSGSRRLFWILVVLLGSLVEFKIYAAVVVLGALGLVALYRLAREGNYNLFFLAAFSGFLSLVLFLPNSSMQTSFLIFEPWWYVRAMIVEPSRLNWLDLELRRQFYAAKGGLRAVLRIIEFEGIAFLIFFFGNLGTRFIGIFDFFKFTAKSRANLTKLFIVLITLLSFIFPLLFLQRGIATNSSQFLQYFVLIFGVLAAISAAKFLALVRSSLLKAVLITAIIIISVPTQIALLKEFYSRNAYAKITNRELLALNFLRDNADKKDVVLVPPFNPELNLKTPVPDIWDWADTAYVAAMTKSAVYFADSEQLDIMGYAFKSRQSETRIVFTEKSPTRVKAALRKTGATVLYFPKAQGPALSPVEMGLTRIFENEKVEIWKI